MADILIASELRDLIGDDPVPGHTVRWLDACEPTPKGDYVAIIPLLSRWMGGTQFKDLRNLKIVANCATGVDNVDLVAAELNRVAVTNTPGVLTESTADLTWALILAVARRLKEGMRLVTDGQWRGWHPTLLLGEELAGKVIGIVGAGRIGQAVGRRAKGFGMRILYTARNRKPEFEQSTGAARLDLATLLGQGDVVSIHLPATPETKGLMNRERFAGMKRGALFINTARGDIVREPALVEALEQGILAGAGLDVFAEEPKVNDALIAHPRVVTLPHLGSATRETRTAMADLAVQNVRAVLAGEAPLTPVFKSR
ncbi:MAG: D-glycerate dehydrogenase [Gemmatimonadetes bacterium]|nr:D-glycerate dehydrogenase [Gemmatimonadota bacterium]